MSDISPSESGVPLATPKPEKLSFSTKLAYGAGDMGPAMTANILVFFLLPFFTNVAGLPAGLAGSVLMIGKISDAINDPIIGVFSDRTRTRWGRRLPWMLFGAIPFGLLFCLQWIVPHFSNNDTVNNWLLFSYYVTIGVLFNIAYTIVNLPYAALTPELTQDYNERTSLNSFRFSFSIGASVLSLVLAGLSFSEYQDDPGKQYLVLGLICTVLSVIPIFWSVFRIQERGAQPILAAKQKQIFGNILTGIGALFVCYGILRIIPLTANFLAAPGRFDLISIAVILIGLQITLFGITLLFSTPEPHLSSSDAVRKRSQSEDIPALTFIQQLKVVFSNRPFLYLIGIYLCSWLAVQLTASILVYFVVSWMGLKNTDSTLVALGVQGTALVMLFFWRIISERVGKKAVYFMGMTLWIIAQAGLFLLQPGQTNLMYVLAVIAGFGVSVAYLIPWSMVPDVIELDELNTGQRREGIFYGFMVLLQKFGLALGLFLVGLALEAAGFIESTAGEVIPTQPDSALLAIRIAIGPLPTLFLIFGLILAYFYPITREFHAEIRLKLQERKSKEGRR
ncbi:MAG: MFS transporter [Symploca sp. SIO3C6]|uniref:MFS transporter n=1 Tax=Symploca sp. SIO1C4 TaxID=2607765 RepID=A0A6B3N7F1_9CYAN|nr:MFS transporter [Symploca sp. SIO3C6]NER27483.1 MFS transporter [Symploca sp. SIO1C4]